MLTSYCCAAYRTIRGKRNPTTVVNSTEEESKSLSNLVLSPFTPYVPLSNDYYQNHLLQLNLSISQQKPMNIYKHTHKRKLAFSNRGIILQSSLPRDYFGHQVLWKCLLWSKSSKLSY